MDSYSSSYPSSWVPKSSGWLGMSGKAWLGIGVFVAIIVGVVLALVFTNRPAKPNPVARTVPPHARRLAAGNRGGSAPGGVRAGPVRAAVMGSFGGRGKDIGHGGAPYGTATPTHTTGPAFPTSAASNGNPMPVARNSIWAEPLPVDGPGYVGARARQAADGLGGNFGLTGNTELYMRTPDELDAKDIDVRRDAFPAPDQKPPKNGHEAIAATYNFANFRSALDEDSAAGGYLAPVLDRAGWQNLGIRDLRVWDEQMEAVKNDFPNNMTLKELEDSQMVPIPTQFLDFAFQAAAQRDIPHRVDPDGMGAPAARELAYALDDEWREGRTPNQIASSDAAAVVREVLSMIPTTDADAAAKVIGEIAQARLQAARDGFAVPEATSSQMQALANWASKPGPARVPAIALARAMNSPLPPPSWH